MRTIARGLAVAGSPLDVSHGAWFGDARSPALAGEVPGRFAGVSNAP